MQNFMALLVFLFNVKSKPLALLECHDAYPLFPRPIIKPSTRAVEEMKQIGWHGSSSNVVNDQMKK